MEMKLSENIRAQRKARGLTQEQLSEVLGHRPVGQGGAPEQGSMYLNHDNSRFPDVHQRGDGLRRRFGCLFHGDGSFGAALTG